MTKETKGAKGKNRETILLVIVALFGLAGLIALQVSRKNATGGRTEDRAVVQVENAEGDNPEASAPIQKIPGELLRTSEYPEAGKPFRFFMSKYSQGPEYELDFGDGSPRKKFVDGAVQHTFRKHGPCVVTLYARYEGQEVALDTLRKIVARVKEDAPIAPILDF
ncbi:MAG: hypothetical protein KDC61_12965 [Saprospiraceae bacterium]|nr:hypothetical protein [Saprospiraceae bacterium]MCB0542175.1 hypothetical protein [Saprospiraceae bacterium]MCB0575463.1 hypothetical protein [Saprospiraceae bacterium]MCB9308231.1 hypothetical protein [Lewinellaceae bacterium]MCB9355085.1 hypothetical protein [Lewinellaceae bacterium]